MSNWREDKGGLASLFRKHLIRKIILAETRQILAGRQINTPVPLPADQDPFADVPRQLIRSQALSLKHMDGRRGQRDADGGLRLIIYEDIFIPATEHEKYVSETARPHADPPLIRHDARYIRLPARSLP